METEQLAVALEREHREIDEGIEAFTSTQGSAQARADALTRAMRALRRHIYLEETLLFPPLRAAGMVAPVFVMLREHGELWRTLDALDAKLGNDPDDMAREICGELLAQLDRHNSKEEPILYPQADTALDAAARATLTAFLASGHTPEGWVCEGARGPA